MYKNKKGAKMQEPNNIDLKDVNKTKKSLRLPKLGNPFKKQDGIKRDAEGKFATTSGNGGLNQNKKMYMKRAIPIVIIVAAFGGILVFQSFAATKRLNVYRYEVNSCNSKSRSFPSCVDYSADGLIYRAYVAYTSTEPQKTSGLYKKWVNEVARGYEKNTLCEMIDPNACNGPAYIDADAKNRRPASISLSEKQAVVNKLYKNTFSRLPTNSESRLFTNNTHYYPSSIVLQFAKLSEVRNFYSRSLNYFIKNKEVADPILDQRPSSCPDKPQIISRGGQNSLTTTYRYFTWDSTSKICKYTDKTVY